MTVDEPVILEEPASSIRTLSSLQYLAKDFSFGDQFFNDKPSEADNEKTTVDTEAESMVSVIIHQDTSAIPPMTSPVIDLVSRPDSPNVHQPLPTTITATATTLTTIMTTIPLPPQPQQGSSDSILINRLGKLEQHISDLVDANQALEERLDKYGSRLYRERFRDLPEADMKEILHNRMWESKSYQTHEDHMTLYEALEKSMARDNSDQLLSNLAEARKKKKKRQGSPKTPPGSPPPPPSPAGPFGTSGASGASGSSQLPPPPPSPSNNQGGQSTSTAAPSSSKTAASAEYTAWITIDTRLKPSVSPIPKELHMDDDTTADEQAYSSSGEDVGRDHIPTASALKSTYTPPPENSLLAQIDDMATFMDWYCKKQGISELTQKDLEGPAYEIVKVIHPDVVYLQFQMEECNKLLIDQVDDAILRSIEPSSRPKQKDTHYSFNLWTRNLVLIQRDIDFQLGIESYQTLLNLTKPRWDAKGFEYKHDFIVIDSPRAVTFRDKYGVQMIMRFNEIHKFSDDSDDDSDDGEVLNELEKYGNAG
ncbi:hypothetical protein Tco_0458469 [Tanacetum coccineum]